MINSWLQLQDHAVMTIYLVTMKAGLILTLITYSFAFALNAQQPCGTYPYHQKQFSNHTSLISTSRSVENFIHQNIAAGQNNRLDNTVIKIPVVVHVLYHFPSEKIGDDVIYDQLALLNECFRLKNSDTSNIPAYFKSLVADCEIEFELATSDPYKKYTTGIIKKYTPITRWSADDKVKSSEEMGDDPWDPASYLNIWVCDLDKYAGYSSVIGGPENVDGIVMGLKAFGANQKTLVHEAGHWLGLKHLWGDEYCGDDGVGDTPKQASYTIGCPTGARVTCSNGPNGDLYMDYMDFTNDACRVMFTQGQKARMKSLFNEGGPRSSILSSKGLNPPLIFEIPLPEDDPKWLEPRVYPNPADHELIVDLNYDARWVGNLLQVINLHGQHVITTVISSKLQTIDISRLPAGIYFLAAKRADGLSIKQKFIKY